MRHTDHRHIMRADRPVAHTWDGRIQAHREAKADRKWVRKEIKAMQREMPAFAILQGIDPENSDPPPYINVRARMLYNHIR